MPCLNQVKIFALAKSGDYPVKQDDKYGSPISS